MTPDSPIRFHVPFSWTSPSGHVVELLERHVEPGVIIDLGATSAPHAERLTDRGYTYVPLGAASAIAHLAERGFAGHAVDLADGDAVRSVLAAMSDAVAIIAVDAASSVGLGGPGRTALTAVGEWASTSGAAVIVTAPNLSHGQRLRQALAGVVDPEHSVCVTEGSLTAALHAVGLSETQRHDLVGVADQIQSSTHPVVSDGARFGAMLRDVHSAADPAAETLHFARLYRAGHNSAVGGERLSGLSIVLHPAMSATDRDNIEAQLTLQTSQDFDVVAPSGDHESLADVLARVERTYFVVVNGGEVLASNWVRQFLATAERYAGSIIRCAPMQPPPNADVAVSWADGFDLLAHLRGPETPNAALAFPSALIDQVGIDLAEAAADAPRRLLLEAQSLCGVVDSGVGAVAPRAGWADREASEAYTLERVDRRALTMSPGSASHLAGVVERMSAAEARQAELEPMVESLTAQVAALEADNERLNAELARGPIRAVRKGLRAIGRDGDLGDG